MHVVDNNKLMEVDEPEKEQETKQLPANVKQLPPNVKSLYPDSLEYVVPGNGACCLNCLAAFIYINANEGPMLGRDLNTHIAEYRNEYIKRMIFPRSVTLGNGKKLNFKKGEEEKFFNCLVESNDLSFMWRCCCNMQFHTIEGGN